MGKCKIECCTRETFQNDHTPRRYDYCLNHACPQEACGLQQHGLDVSCRDAPKLEDAPEPPSNVVLPVEAQARKDVPICRGVLDYFPNALAAVAALSKKGNDQHNPGHEMHWARNKSTDHADCIVRHLVDRGTNDTDGVPHSAKVAWRALALLETELLEAGAKPGRNARE